MGRRSLAAFEVGLARGWAATASLFPPRGLPVGGAAARCRSRDPHAWGQAGAGGGDARSTPSDSGAPGCDSGVSEREGRARPALTDGGGEARGRRQRRRHAEWPPIPPGPELSALPCERAMRGDRSPGAGRTQTCGVPRVSRSLSRLGAARAWDTIRERSRGAARGAVPAPQPGKVPARNRPQASAVA